MTADVFEDLVRLLHDWKQNPKTRIKAELYRFLTLSPLHREARSEVFRMAMADMRFGISAQWWMHAQPKSPPPFIQTLVKLMIAVALTEGCISGWEQELAMTIAKRHFSGPVAKWVYYVLKHLQAGKVRSWFAQAPDQSPGRAPTHVQVGLPEWIFQRISDRVGCNPDVCRDMCLGKNIPHPISIRVNPKTTTREAVADELSKLGGERVHIHMHTSNPWGMYVTGFGHPLEEMDLFRQGHISIQSESSLVVGEIVKHLSNLTMDVLDMAAAPGGKTLLFWQTASFAELTAMAKDDKQLEVFLNNVGRDVTAHIPTFVCDVMTDTAVPSSRRYDVIVCDVPCSNLGTVFSKPDVRFRHQPEEFQKLVVIQQRFLHLAAAWLKPGGKIVYVVCSQEPEETDDVIQTFLEQQGANFAIDPVPIVCDGLVQTPYGVRYNWFERPYWDGYYVAVLQKMSAI